MKPDLLNFDLFGYKVDVPIYYAMLLLGVLVAILIAQREGNRRGLNPNRVMDLGILCLLGGLIGARILHVIADGYFWDYVYQCTDPAKTDWGFTRSECMSYAQDGWVWEPALNSCIHPEPDCTKAFRFWEGGLAYYGGMLLGTLVGYIYVKRSKIGVGNGADLAGLGLPVGLFFGRLGCFLVGCCFGRLCDLPWAVSFPPGSEASKHQVLLAAKASRIFPELAPYLPFTRNVESLPVHPTQLYEALACALIFGYLYFVARKRQVFRGELFWRSLLLYGVARFVIELWRDDPRGALLGLSTSQLIALPMIVAGVIALVVLPKRLPKFEQPD